MKSFMDKQCPECKFWMDNLKGHHCDPEEAKKLNELAESMGNHWNYRVCAFIKDGHKKIGIFEVYYNKDNIPRMHSAEPILSWFLEEDSVEDVQTSAKSDLEWMLTALKAPTLDIDKDF